jgi:hypothetical protein
MRLPGFTAEAGLTQLNGRYNLPGTATAGPRTSVEMASIIPGGCNPNAPAGDLPLPGCLRYMSVLRRGYVAQRSRRKQLLRIFCIALHHPSARRRRREWWTDTASRSGSSVAFAGTTLWYPVAIVSVPGLET